VAFVTFDVRQQGQEPRQVTLGPGSLIGRLETAALQIDNATVSEAHALVSLRKGGLQLIALRRRFEVEGQWVSEVALAPGHEIQLTEDVSLVVVELGLPDEILGICWGAHEVPLLHDAAAVVFDPDPSLSWRVEGEAALRLWRVGEGWRYQLPDEPAADLEIGQRWTLQGVDFEVRSLPVTHAAGSATVSPRDPLRLVLFYDTLHIQAAGRPVLVIGGNAARLVSELASAGVPMSWQAVAGELWPEGGDEYAVRKRLDAMLGRFRKKLARGGFRTDLVRASGHGLLELRLGPSDIVDDRS